MNRAVTSLLLINMLFNMLIIGAVVKIAIDGVCIDPVYYVPPILKDEKP